ncbi:hypothetical protein Tsubulata_933674 [Turnera subulata]|uniref:non-specific serine/threonine protein kinase n=1 Tax=Turnera subulata TaxID=218843 RepID=A0A9Q0G0T2_9ROSI|nr:hypothetical protein Tsubulata_933674 [Turnera subulata]
MVVAYLPLLLSLHSILVVSSILILLATVGFSRDDGGYSECKKPFDCGLLRNLSYPFWGGDRPQYCGHPAFRLLCQVGQYPSIAGDREPEQFRLVGVDPNRKVMTLEVIKLEQYICPQNPENKTLNPSFLSFPDTNLRTLNLLYNFTEGMYPLGTVGGINGCPGWGESYFGFERWPTESGQYPPMCNVTIRIPVPGDAVDGLQKRGKPAVEGLLGEGYNLSYLYGSAPTICQGCTSSGGVCGSNSTDPSRFVCLCRHNSTPDICNTYIILLSQFTGAVAGVTGILFSIFFCYVCRRTPSIRIGKIATNNQDLETFIRSHGPLAIKRYSFFDVKKMTCQFKAKLGQGGYGSVYEGKLQDGRPVAVKVLNASKGNGEELINEVASISRTSHVNIVTLVGFCLEGCNRVLIYDFMPNGSLEKFINKKNGTIESSRELGWEKMYQIAVGVARGLEYLHRGCNTRIVHFDIKPHNILLDEDFCPKISDFGLARLCQRKESIMSMLEARGTIGYIAPEVFTRQFGGVSHKSDVYSYGMMILEMVGAIENDGTVADATSEYFPAWIYRRLELGKEHELQGVTTAEEIENVRKMTIVGLWCIQTVPSDRPAISKVIEMLEGSLETLKIPPQPSPSSPAKFVSYPSNASDNLTL